MISSWQRALKREKRGHWEKKREEKGRNGVAERVLFVRSFIFKNTFHMSEVDCACCMFKVYFIYFLLKLVFPGLQNQSFFQQRCEHLYSHDAAKYSQHYCCLYCIGLIVQTSQWDPMEWWSVLPSFSCLSPFLSLCPVLPILLFFFRRISLPSQNNLLSPHLCLFSFWQRESCHRRQESSVFKPSELTCCLRLHR